MTHSKMVRSPSTPPESEIGSTTGCDGIVGVEFGPLSRIERDDEMGAGGKTETSGPIGVPTKGSGPPATTGV